MRKQSGQRIAVLLVAVIAAGGTSAAPARAGCKTVKINEQQRCVRAGDVCKRKYEKKYLRVKLSCSKRDGSKWRLQKASQVF